MAFFVLWDTIKGREHCEKTDGIQMFFQRKVIKHG